jgi:hypothetical protein
MTSDSGQPSTRLKALLRERHWQTYKTFTSEYDKAARSIDPRLADSVPSRAQLHRWLAGDLVGLPYPDHCRVLEKMFPGWTAEQLFESLPAGHAEPSLRLVQAIRDGFEATSPDSIDWGISDPATSARHDSPDDNREEAAGLLLPDDDLDLGETAHTLGQKLATLGRVLRLSPIELKQLATLSGNVVDLAVEIELDIESDGSAKVAYYYHHLNLSSKPLTRMPRELWFQYADGPLTITPVETAGKHRMVIQRIHDSPNLAKFACRLSPAVQPGDSASTAFVCTGGQFVDAYYWRQNIYRYTRHLTIVIRHRGMRDYLRECNAVEELPDGAENSASDSLTWDYDDRDVVITLTRDYLHPTQAVTVRWDINEHT